MTKDVNSWNPSKGSVITIELGEYGLNIKNRRHEVTNDLWIIFFPSSSLFSKRYRIAPTINERLADTIAIHSRIGNNPERISITKTGKFFKLLKKSRESLSTISVIVIEIFAIFGKNPELIFQISELKKWRKI